MSYEFLLAAVAREKAERLSLGDDVERLRKKNKKLQAEVERQVVGDDLADLRSKATALCLASRDLVNDGPHSMNAVGLGCFTQLVCALELVEAEFGIDQDGIRYVLKAVRP